GGFDDSQRKVFMEPLLVEEKTMAKTHFTVDPFRPDWQFNVNGTTKQKLCIGTHNVDDAMKRFVAATKSTTPKFHVVLCDEQFDADGVETDAVDFKFDADRTRDVELKSTNVSNGYLTITDPPLQGGNLVKSAVWQAEKKVAGAWTIAHSGDLPAANVKLRKDRTSKRMVRLTAPAKCGGAAGGCRCGGPCARRQQPHLGHAGAASRERRLQRLGAERPSGQRGEGRAGGLCSSQHHGPRAGASFRHDPREQRRGHSRSPAVL